MPARAPRRYVAPPFLIAYPPGLKLRGLDPYGFQIQSRVTDEFVQSTFLRIKDTPFSYGLYEDHLDAWLQAVSKRAREHVQEYWIPIRTEDLTLLPVFPTENVIGNPDYVFIRLTDREQLDGVIQALLPPVPIELVPVAPPMLPVVWRGIPSIPPARGVLWKPTAIESIREIATVTGVRTGTLSKRLRAGLSTRNYRDASVSDAPAPTLKALNVARIPYTELIGKKRLSSRSAAKLDRLARREYGVSGTHLARIIRGQRTYTDKYK